MMLNVTKEKYSSWSTDFYNSKMNAQPQEPAFFTYPQSKQNQEAVECQVITNIHVLVYRSTCVCMQANVHARLSWC